MSLKNPKAKKPWPRDKCQWPKHLLLGEQSRLADGNIKQTTLTKVDEEPIPKGKWRVAKVTMVQRMTSLRIIVRDGKELNPTRVMKPPLACNAQR